VFAFMSKEADLVHDHFGNVPVILAVFDIPIKLLGLPKRHRIEPAQTQVRLDLCAAYLRFDIDAEFAA